MEPGYENKEETGLKSFRLQDAEPKYDQEDEQDTEPNYEQDTEPEYTRDTKKETETNLLTVEVNDLVKRVRILEANVTTLTSALVQLRKSNVVRAEHGTEEGILFLVFLGAWTVFDIIVLNSPDILRPWYILFQLVIFTLAAAKDIQLRRQLIILMIFCSGITLFVDMVLRHGPLWTLFFPIMVQTFTLFIFRSTNEVRNL